MTAATAVASDTEVVARAIARAIAIKTINADPRLAGLGGLTAEAEAALEAFGKLA